MISEGESVEADGEYACVGERAPESFRVAILVHLAITVVDHRNEMRGLRYYLQVS